MARQESLGKDRIDSDFVGYFRHRIYAEFVACFWGTA